MMVRVLSDPFPDCVALNKSLALGFSPVKGMTIVLANSG